MLQPKIGRAMTKTQHSQRNIFRRVHQGLLLGIPGRDDLQGAKPPSGDFTVFHFWGKSSSLPREREDAEKRGGALAWTLVVVEQDAVGLHGSMEAFPCPCL